MMEWRKKYRIKTEFGPSYDSRFVKNCKGINLYNLNIKYELDITEENFIYDCVGILIVDCSGKDWRIRYDVVEEDIVENRKRKLKNINLK